MGEPLTITGAVWAAMNTDGRLAALRVRANASDVPVDLADRLSAWAGQISSELGPDEDVSVQWVRRLPDGSVTLAVVKPTSDDAYRHTIKSLSDVLNSFEGLNLDVEKREVPKMYFTNVQTFGTVIHVSPRLSEIAQLLPPGPNVRARPVPKPGWDQLDRGVREAAVAHALAWATLPESRQYVMYGHLALEVQLETRDSIANDLLASRIESNVYVVSEDAARRSRVAIFTPSAEMMYEDLRFDQFDSSREALKIAVEVLTSVSRFANSGFALRGIHAAMSIFRFLDPRVWPERPDPPVNNSASLRVLADKWILDTFPVMLVSPEILGKISGPVPYRQTEVGGQNVLLISEDVDRWLAGTRPPTATVLAAREQLRSVILTDARYQDERRKAVARWLSESTTLPNPSA